MSTRQITRVASVTPTNFDALVVESSLPVLVSFQTSWSKAMLPLLSRLAEVFAGQLQVVQVNIAAHPGLAARFKIRAVPTLLLFKNGVPVEFIVGIVPARFIFETVRKALGLCPDRPKTGRTKPAARWSWKFGLVPGSTFA